MNEINLDIKLGVRDLYAFSMRHTYTGMSGIFGLIISFGSLIICGVRFRYLDRTTIIALIIIGMIFTVIQPLILLSKASAQVKKNKDIKGDLHYDILEDGIVISQGEQQAQVKWYQIRKKILTKNSMYLYMSPVRAFIFPKEQCGEQFDELVNVVDSQMEKYKDFEPEPDEYDAEVQNVDEEQNDD